MVHAFVPQHLIDFAEYLQNQDFSAENYDLQCIHRTIVNRAYLSTYLHTKEWIIINGIHHDIRKYSEKKVGYHTAIKLPRLIEAVDFKNFLGIHKFNRLRPFNGVYVIQEYYRYRGIFNPSSMLYGK